MTKGQTPQKSIHIFLNRLSLVDSTLGASFEEDLADEIEDTLYHPLVEYLSVLGDCAVTFYQGDFKSSGRARIARERTRSTTLLWTISGAGRSSMAGKLRSVWR
jgi:hypothetical protein